MAKPKAVNRGGRPPNPHKAPLPPVTGVRIPDDLRDALDVIVDRENAALAEKGASTNRNALIVRLLREAVARDAAAHPAHAHEGDTL